MDSRASLGKSSGVPEHVVRESLDAVSNAVEKIETLDIIPARPARRMAAGPPMAKPPMIGSKRNSEAVKDEIPSMDLGGNQPRRMAGGPTAGGYNPSAAGNSYAPSGGYNPSANDNRLKRGSVPGGRQMVADPFAKYDNDKPANDYDPFANVKKPESIPSQVNAPGGSSLRN